MISEFSQMVHGMVLECPISARELAKGVGKPYSTLLREINPYDTGAKLGVETYFQLIEKTGDLSSLEYMLHRLGFCLAPLDAPLAEAWRKRPRPVPGYSQQYSGQQRESARENEPDAQDRKEGMEEDELLHV